MKALLYRIHNHPRYTKATHWGKLVTITGSGQIIVQLLGLISGIIVIRFLPTKEYALYTLVNAMLGTITVLADGGITSGVMAQGGKVWQNREKLGIVIASGLHLRKKFAFISLLISTPALFYLLLQHGGSWMTSLLIILSLIPAFYASFSDTLLEIPSKLLQQIAPLQKNQVEVSIGRLLLTGVAIFFFPFAYMAVLASGIPRIWGNKRLTKLSHDYADFKQNQSPEVNKEILKFVRRILPGAIYYCISGQITLWFISIFGTTKAVAQIGALGRLSMMLGFFSVLFNTLISPRFARLPLNSRVLQLRYIQIHIGLLFFSLCIVGVVWTFPGQVLWILGKDYSNLKSELILNIIGSCIGLISGLSFSLYTSRGWAINPIISIPINVSAIILGIVLFNISSVSGILMFNIFLAVIQALVNGLYGYLKVVKSK